MCWLNNTIILKGVKKVCGLYIHYEPTKPITSPHPLPNTPDKL